MGFKLSLHVFVRDSIQLLADMESHLRDLDAMPGDENTLRKIQSCVKQVKLSAMSSGVNKRVSYAVLIECLYKKYLMGEIGLLTLIVASLLRDYETRQHPEHTALPAVPPAYRASAAANMKPALSVHNFEMA